MKSLSKRAPQSDQVAILREQRAFMREERLLATLHQAVRWAGLVGLAWVCFRCVDAVAGKTTLANVVFNLLSDMRINQALAAVLGAGGIFYGWRNKVRRRSDTERLHRRIKELEERIDPHRTSSQLTPRGETRPEDEL